MPMMMMMMMTMMIHCNHGPISYRFRVIGDIFFVVKRKFSTIFQSIF